MHARRTCVNVPFHSLVERRHVRDGPLVSIVCTSCETKVLEEAQRTGRSRARFQEIKDLVRTFPVEIVRPL